MYQKTILRQPTRQAIRKILHSVSIFGRTATGPRAGKRIARAGGALDLEDLVVLDIKDIRALQQNPELCFEMADRVLATMVAGKIQYQKAGFRF